eukprot:gene26086-31949_t
MLWKDGPCFFSNRLSWRTTVFAPGKLTARTARRYFVEFDGVDDYLLAATVGDIQSISIWVWKDSDQPQPHHYLLDARFGAPNGYFSNLLHGPHWTGMFIDGIPVAYNFSYLPVGDWFHLHIESDELMNDNVNFMSRVNEKLEGSHCLK